jgi:hypothetical protein
MHQLPTVTANLPLISAPPTVLHIASIDAPVLEKQILQFSLSNVRGKFSYKECHCAGVKVIFSPFSKEIFINQFACFYETRRK